MIMVRRHWIVPKEHLKIARHFNAGFNPQNITSPGGTTDIFQRNNGNGRNRAPFVQPSLRDSCRCGRIPGVETPGYCRVVPLGRGRAGSPLHAERPNAKTGAHGVTRPTNRILNAAGTTGRVAHARGWAMTENFDRIYRMNRIFLVQSCQSCSSCQKSGAAGVLRTPCRVEATRRVLTQ